jgi:hypothetical protein
MNRAIMTRPRVPDSRIWSSRIQPQQVPRAQHSRRTQSGIQAQAGVHTHNASHLPPKQPTSYEVVTGENIILGSDDEDDDEEGDDAAPSSRAEKDQ